MANKLLKSPATPAVRFVLLATAAVILLWFLRQMADILILSAFAIVLAIVFSAPVTWLEQRRVSRGLAAVMVFALVALGLAALGWVVLPQFTKEMADLGQNLPSYVTDLRDHVASFLDPYPQVEESLPLNAEDVGDVVPSLPTVAKRITHFSLSLAAAIAAALVLSAMVVYAVARPRPLLQLYLDLFPARHRPRAARAFSQASVMLVGWIRSNLIVGAIEAVLVGAALALLGVPAALVWASLAFFAELVPRVGIYLMAVPPVLVALAVDPMKAVWVALFYVAMNEIVGNFVTPRIRASAMDLHPVSVLFVMLAMVAVFGLPGALIATPITAVIKAYFAEFYPPARHSLAGEDTLVEGMLRRDVPASPDAGGSMQS